MKIYKNQNKNRKNYLLKVLSGQKAERYETHSVRRFLNHVRTLNFSKIIKIYLRVSYGYKIVRTTAYNDGTYTNKEDFYMALKAFLEK